MYGLYNWTVYLATYYLNVVGYANLAKNDCEWFRIHYVSVISSGESYCPGEGHSRRVWNIFEVSSQWRAVRVWENLSEWSYWVSNLVRGDCLLWSSRICHWQPCFLSPLLWLALCLCCFLLCVLLSACSLSLCSHLWKSCPSHRGLCS